MEPFLGEVRLLPYNYAPKGWALCNGQILPISSNSALFSLLGTNYGGNGTTTFGLPNLPGCVVVGAGQGPGLQNWDIGQEEGSDTVTLTTPEMPAHNHSLSGLDVVGTAGAPSNTAWLGQDRRGGTGNVDFLAPTATIVDTAMDPQVLTPSTGGGEAHENRQPFLGVNYCIATQGIFPQRP
jgi:microcystin-dependent protein